MSSYVVSANTIEKATNGIFASSNGTMSYHEVNDLGRAFYAMNAEAVSLRYGNLRKDVNFRWDGTAALAATRQDKIDFLGCLRCLRYQCAEDGVYKSDLYNYLDEIFDILKAQINPTQAEFDNAPWGCE